MMKNWSFLSFSSNFRDMKKVMPLDFGDKNVVLGTKKAS